MVDELPKHLKFLSASASQGGYALSKSTVTCQLGDLPSGTTAEITIAARPLVMGSVVNSASVGAVQPPDPDGSNNTVSENTSVRL